MVRSHFQLENSRVGWRPNRPRRLPSLMQRPIARGNAAERANLTNRGGVGRSPKTLLQPARQLPDQSTSFWVDSSSKSDSCLRGALPRIGLPRSTVGLLSQQPSRSGTGPARAGSVPARLSVRVRSCFPVGNVRLQSGFPRDQISVVKRRDRYRLGKRLLQRLAQPQPR